MKPSLVEMGDDGQRCQRAKQKPSCHGERKVGKDEVLEADPGRPVYQVDYW